MGDAENRRVIAARLREARQLAGLSQGQVAKQMDMHRPTITEIEAGNRRVSVDELKQFAALYDVKIAFLMGETSDALELDDPKLKLAARELSKLPPESLEKLLRALAAFRERDEGDR